MDIAVFCKLFYEGEKWIVWWRNAGPSALDHLVKGLFFYTCVGASSLEWYVLSYLNLNKENSLYQNVLYL